MKRAILLSIIALAFVMNTSCKKNDDVKGAKAKFTVKEKTSNRLAAKGASVGTFTFTKAEIGISKVDFEIQTNTNDNEYEYEGNYTFDILTGTSTPPIPYVEVDPGTYHDLEIKVDRTLSGGNSIDIVGIYTIAGVSYNFEYTSTMDEDYDIENMEGVRIDPNSTVTFTLYIDLPSLFSGLDFASAIVGPNNVIQINNQVNSNLAETIEDRFDDVMDFDD